VLPLGKPLVVTDLPIFADARDALRLVEPGDTAGLTTAIAEVLRNPQLQRELSRRTTAAARRFRWSLAVAQHREIYTTIRAERRQRTSLGAQSIPGYLVDGRDKGSLDSTDIWRSRRGGRTCAYEKSHSASSPGSRSEHHVFSRVRFGL